MTEPTADECETIHGLPCDELGEELPAEIDAMLPPGDLIEYARVTAIAYIAPDGIEDGHEFKTPVHLWIAAPGVVYLLGDFHVTEEGIVDGPAP